MVISCEITLRVVTCCNHRMNSKVKLNFSTFLLALNLARIIQVVNSLCSPIPLILLLQSKNDLAILLPPIAHRPALDARCRFEIFDRRIIHMFVTTLNYTVNYSLLNALLYNQYLKLARPTLVNKYRSCFFLAYLFPHSTLHSIFTQVYLPQHSNFYRFCPSLP